MQLRSSPRITLLLVAVACISLPAEGGEFRIDLPSLTVDTKPEVPFLQAEFDFGFAFRSIESMSLVVTLGESHGNLRSVGDRVEFDHLRSLVIPAEGGPFEDRFLDLTFVPTLEVPANVPTQLGVFSFGRPLSGRGVVSMRNVLLRADPPDGSGLLIQPQLVATSKPPIPIAATLVVVGTTVPEPPLPGLLLAGMSIWASSLRQRP